MPVSQNSRFAAFGLTALLLTASGSSFYLWQQAAGPSSFSSPVWPAGSGKVSWSRPVPVASESVVISLPPPVIDATVEISVDIESVVTSQPWMGGEGAEPTEPGAAPLAAEEEAALEGPALAEQRRAWRAGGGRMGAVGTKESIAKRVGSGRGVNAGDARVGVLAARVAVAAPPPVSVAADSPAPQVSGSVPPPVESVPETPVSSGSEPSVDPEIPTTRAFTFWNALLFSGQPQALEANPDFPKLRMVYSWELWQGEDSTYPREDRIRAIARSVEAGRVLCYDIEHWPLDPENAEEFQANLAKFLDVARWTRDENPGIKFGFYAIMPELRPDVSRLAYDHPRYVASRARNDLMAPLVREVDVLFPWLYTVTDVSKRDLWRVWAANTIREARRIGGDKPVIPFMWFRYHQIYSDRSLQLIEPEYWREHMELVRELADGVALWGGYDQAWSVSMPWWQVTEPYLGEPVPVRWGD